VRADFVEKRRPCLLIPRPRRPGNGNIRGTTGQWEEAVPKYLCKACGTQHPERARPPERCRICEDERQFVPATGQEWITVEALAASRFNVFRKTAPGLFGISTVPQFAIGQRAFLAVTPAGNILWDCISLLDAATIEIIGGLGGLKAVALSHPHFYSAMATWGRAFDCPVFVHEADRDWLVEPDPGIEYWSGETRDVLPGAVLHRLGGHFPGSAVLHLAEPRILLTGDTMLVTPDQRHVSFMWSYPNYVPLAAAEVERIGRRLATLDFDAIYSAFWGRGDIPEDAKAAVDRSIARHIRGYGALGETP
jgi:glyoxylase-like metal-dependent hydrolase (beta-lactamase superfamily II)